MASNKVTKEKKEKRRAKNLAADQKLRRQDACWKPIAKK